MNVISGNDQDGTICAHSQRGTQSFLILLHTNRNRNHLIGLACFFEPDGLLNCDFVEGIHRHFYIGQIDAVAVRFNSPSGSVKAYCGVVVKLMARTVRVKFRGCAGFETFDVKTERVLTVAS